MRVPISWLREFVALPDDADAIAERLAMLGFPVDGIERRPPISGVVTGKIVTLEKHPNADRLLVARVDVARDEPLTIATAATNVAAGQTIAVATIGARLPALTIEARTMRGVASQGMMISAEELALPGEWFEDGIMQLETGIAAGLDAVALFGLDTAVLDVEITANRPDSMSVLGLARELAASCGSTVRLPSFANPGKAREREGEALRVDLESPDCRRFIAQRFDALAVAPAPAWIRIRLALAGQRPINNLVDVSNYVMLETGQPLHFYDARAIAVRLVARDARAGERITTLDGAERTLTPQSLVIADDERALGLAGLMGGATSEVTATTTAIVLESANFHGPRIRRMSAALGLRSEASSRHEKSLAPALADLGAARAAQLLCGLGATAYEPHAFGERLAIAPAIPLSAGDVTRLLGLSIPAERIAEHLGALGCEVERTGETLSVTPPPWRRDITISADLVEEVARVEGYDRIASVVPSVPAHEISSADFVLENRMARSLAALGYVEVIAHSLRASQGEGSVEVRNPLSEEQRFLRDSLAPGLIEYLAGVPAPARVFEIGDVFRRDGDDVNERTVAAFGFSVDASGEPEWQDSWFLRLKGDAEALIRQITGSATQVSPDAAPGFHPGKTAALTVGDSRVGTLGCVDPRVVKAAGLKRSVYLCAIDVRSLPRFLTPAYRPPSKFPSTYRDLALVVDAGLAAGDLQDALRAALGPICTAVRVFDEYRGPQVQDGRKSLAVRASLQRFDATITDEEADAAVAGALETLGRRFGATLRT